MQERRQWGFAYLVWWWKAAAGPERNSHKVAFGIRWRQSLGGDAVGATRRELIMSAAAAALCCGSSRAAFGYVKTYSKAMLAYFSGEAKDNGFLFRSTN